MKKKLIYIAFFTLLSLKVNAQFELLDEPVGTNTGFVYSLSVYDNDILYSMISNSNNGNNDVFISNGYKDDRLELLNGSNARAYFNTTIDQSQYRLYGEGKYTTGKDIYAKIIETDGVNNVFKLSTLRNSFTPENRFTKSSIGGNENINLVANDGLITIDTIKGNDSSELLLRHFIKNSTTSETREYQVSQELFSGNPGNFFSWSDKLFFVAEASGEKDIYKIDALTDVRVTENKVSKPTVFKGVSPNNFLLADDYIYFLGRDGFYTNVTPGPVTRNYPTAVSYTNGDIDFGSTETEIFNTDDGSLGYKSYTDTENSEVILGKVNDQILYYVKGSFGGSFLALPSRESLGIATQSGTQTFNFIQLNDKVYVLSKLGFNNIKLYATNGFLNSTTSFDIPNFSETSEGINSFGALKINNGKIYFIGSYTVSGEQRFQLLSYTPETSEIIIEFVFPDDVAVNSNNFYAHTTGFVFTTNDGKIYTWNIEKRSKILDPNSVAKGGNSQRIANLKYNQLEYPITLNTVATEVAKVRTQILDTLSNQYKYEINSLPSQYDAQKISTLFYNLGSIESSTDSNNFEIEISYQNEMFVNAPSVDISKLTVLVFDNNSWKEISPTSFNSTTKTITINTDLSKNAYLFLKLNQTLAVDDELSFNNNEISLYPNPVTKDVVLVSNNNAIDEVQLFNILGKKVFQNSFVNATKTTMDLSYLASGIYVVKVKSGNTISTQKIIKKDYPR